MFSLKWNIRWRKGTAAQTIRSVQFRELRTHVVCPSPLTMPQTLAHQINNRHKLPISRENKPTNRHPGNETGQSTGGRTDDVHNNNNGGHQQHELGPFRSLVEILVFEKAVLELKVLFLALAPLLVVKVDIRALDNTRGRRQQRPSTNAA